MKMKDERIIFLAIYLINKQKRLKSKSLEAK